MDEFFTAQFSIIVHALLDIFLHSTKFKTNQRHKNLFSAELHENLVTWHHFHYFLSQRRQKKVSKFEALLEKL